MSSTLLNAAQSSVMINVAHTNVDRLIRDAKIVLNAHPGVYRTTHATISSFRATLDHTYPAVLRALLCVHFIHNIPRIRVPQNCAVLPDDVIVTGIENQLVFPRHDAILDGTQVAVAYEGFKFACRFIVLDPCELSQVVRLTDELMTKLPTVEITTELAMIRDELIRRTLADRQDMTPTSHPAQHAAAYSLFHLERHPPLIRNYIIGHGATAKAVAAPQFAPRRLMVAKDILQPSSMAISSMVPCRRAPMSDEDACATLRLMANTNTTGARSEEETDTDSDVEDAIYNAARTIGIASRGRGRDEEEEYDDIDAHTGGHKRTATWLDTQASPKVARHDEGQAEEGERESAWDDDDCTTLRRVFEPFIPRSLFDTMTMLEVGELSWYCHGDPNPDEQPSSAYDYGSFNPRRDFDPRQLADTFERLVRGTNESVYDVLSSFEQSTEGRVAWSILGGTTYLPWKRMLPYFTTVGCGEITRSRYPQMFEARAFCGCPTTVLSRAVTRGLFRAAPDGAASSASSAKRKSAHATPSSVLPFTRGRPVVTDSFIFALSRGFYRHVHPLMQFAASIVRPSDVGSRCSELALTTRVEPTTLHMTLCMRADVHIGSIMRRMRYCTYDSWVDERLVQQIITMRTSRFAYPSAIRELSGTILTHAALIFSPLIEHHHAHAPHECVACAQCGVVPTGWTRDFSQIAASEPDVTAALLAGIAAHPFFSDSFAKVLRPLFALDTPIDLRSVPDCAATRYAIACAWAIVCDWSLLALLRAQHPRDERDRVLPKLDNMVRAYTIFALKISGTFSAPTFAESSIDGDVNGVMSGIMECATCIASVNMSRVRVFADAQTNVAAGSMETLRVNTRIQVQGSDGVESRQARMGVERGASGKRHDWSASVSQSTSRRDE